MINFTMKKNILLIVICLLLLGKKGISGIIIITKTTDSVSTVIRMNQLGFYPDARKIAIIVAGQYKKFSIVTADKKTRVFTGNLSESAENALNGRKTLIADFSSFNKIGKYVIRIRGLGYSYPFEIGPFVYRELAKASVKAYYYQRASVDLPEKYAGKWHRKMGHPDDKVFIHPSAASADRPAGSIINAAGGWYDAGDYNKYIVNSGISTGTLLSLCEDFPDHVSRVKLNLPESGNQAPDILNEILYNVRWMLRMQDPQDGGVYNKLTNADFDAMEMPDHARAPRYVVQKGTAATLDLSAVTAQAARVLRRYARQFPGLADSCLEASKKAWAWARNNPDSIYDQKELNKKYRPGITTGGYGDRNLKDEMIWAAAELYITTGDNVYYNAVNMIPDTLMPLPSWSNVRMLGYYSLVRNEQLLSNKALSDTKVLKNRLLKLADDLIRNIDKKAYQTVMGTTARDFFWGSNSLAGNQAIALIHAYRISGNERYLDGALSNVDYLLGRNGTGYCYVTGFGYKSPMHPHHRVSIADGVLPPVPGLLVAGPNPGMQDGIKLRSLVPDEAYIDDQRAYAVNEIAINWNAPLAYISNALEAIMAKPHVIKK